MKGKGVTIREAAEMWVREMDAIQHGIIETLMKAEPDKWTEVTKPRACDRVYVFNFPDDVDSEERNGEVRSYDEETELYCIELDDGKLVSCEEEDFEVEYDGGLPMWGTLWSFGDSADDWWLEEGDGIQKMSECGFRIYEHEEYGYFFGIDGAGYSFFEEHWVPLYKARGLQWHDSSTDDPEYKPCGYNPVYKAYETLRKELHSEDGESGIYAAVEEAIGFLGEALE